MHPRRAECALGAWVGRPRRPPSPRLESLRRLPAASRLPDPTDGDMSATLRATAPARRPMHASVRDDGLHDDLRLAHVLADNADSITMRRFKALDLGGRPSPT